MKILIVEDEKTLADSIAALMRSNRYETQVAYEGRTGLELAESGRFDLLILDVMLPYINGFEIVKSLRSGGSDLPILLLTAKSDLSDRVGIFVQGKLIACGPISELGKQLQNEGLSILDVMAQPLTPELHDLIRAQKEVTSLTWDADGLMHIESRKDIHRQLMKLLLEKGYDVTLLRQRGGDLDEIYRRYFEKAGEQHDHIHVDENGKETPWRKLLQRAKGK